MIDSFELGYSDPGGQALTRALSEKSFTTAQLEASGLVRKRAEGSGYYDYFRGRLMFPIHNESGKIIAFGGRAMGDDDQPKYLNSPETPIYRKTSVLYNLHRARDGMRRSNRAVLVEGYMDVIGVAAAGVKEVVASCGTALTNAQVRTIHRHADTVVVNFDPDTAGANAAEKAVQLFLDEGLHVRVLALGDPESEVKLDPDEFVKRNGPEAYRARLDKASGYFYWLADRARARFDMKTSEGRVDAFKFLLPAVQKIPERLERAAVANDLAGYLGVEPSLVLDQFRRAATDRKTPVAPKEAKTIIPATEQILLSAALASARVREEILPALSSELIQSFITREIFEALRQITEAGSPVAFAALEGRLGGASQVLLHQAIAADDTEDEDILRERAEACLRRLRSDSQKRNLDELRGRVKAAERAGRFEEALNWMAELSRLEREMRSAPQ
jgi:DNA primase